MKTFIVLFGLAIGVGLWVWLANSYDDPEPAADPQLLTVRETDPFKGSRNAPVTVIMAGSFTCPACSEAAGQMDQLIAIYGDDLKVVWKDLPEDADESYQTALAARCAQRQGRFWQYHDLLMDEHTATGGARDYGAWARQTGLLSDQFGQCLANRETAVSVDASIAESIRTQVQHVPYFQINNTDSLEGRQNLATFRQIIDRSLENR